MTRRAVLVLVAVALAGLPGCGGDDEDERAGADKGARTETTTTATESSRPAPDRDERAADGDDPKPSEPRPAEPERAAPSSPAGLPSKEQREAAADSVCRTKKTVGENVPPRLERLCDALREAARADTLAEYQRALGSAVPR